MTGILLLGTITESITQTRGKHYADMIIIQENTSGGGQDNKIILEDEQ